MTRPRVRLVCAARLLWAFFGALLCVSPARADWLSLLAPCEPRDEKRPLLALIYPRPFLPALVHAGEELVVRVQLPAALTPPPGVQQVRALHGFSAELLGSSPAYGSAALPPHRHRLPVMGLRPDAGDTLVYRVSVIVPAYAAPGTYSLRVRTPFGELGADALVRVLAAGAELRLGALEGPASVVAQRHGAPVDVWISRTHEIPHETSDETSRDAAGNVVGPLQLTEPSVSPAPVLGLRDLRALLRLKDEAFLLDTCAAGAPDPARARAAREFSSDARAKASAEGLNVHSGLEPKITLFRPVRPEAFMADAAADERQRARPSLGSEHVELANAWPWPQVHVVRVSTSLRVTTEDVQLTRYPGHDLSHALAAQVLAVHLPARTRAVLRLHSVPPARSTAQALEIDPASPRAGESFSLRVPGASSKAIVAYQLGHARAAWARGPFASQLDGPGRVAIRFASFEPDGTIAQGEAELRVRARRPGACSVALVGLALGVGASAQAGDGAGARAGERAFFAGGGAFLLGLGLLCARQRLAKKARRSKGPE